MADPVPVLRAPKSPGAGARIIKAISHQGSAIRRLLEHRQSRDDLVKGGIYKPEPIFGNFLDNLPLDDQSGLPIFIKVIVAKIEAKIDTVGLYRVNGDNAAMQKLRYVSFKT